MNPIPELERKLENLVRLGHVSAVDPAKGCRVKSGGIETDWLPWLELRAGSDRTWWPPSVEEQVVLLCPGGNPANGIVLFGIFSDANPAPAASLALVVLAKMRDGSLIIYDTAAHHLQADLAGSATLTTVGNLFASIGGDITASAVGNVAVTADGDLSAAASNIAATTPGTLTAQAGSASVTAASITLNGAVTVNGPLQLNGPLSAGPGAGGAGGATFIGNIAIEGAVEASGDMAAANVTATEVTASGITLTSRASAS